MRTLKSQLTTEQLSIKKKVEPTKDILQPKTKKESQDGRRGDSWYKKTTPYPPG